VVTVYHDPADPSKSVLRRGATSASEVSPYLVLLAAVVGLFLLFDRLRTLRLRIALSVAPIVVVGLAEWLIFG
jgi:hypothetical protein